MTDQTFTILANLLVESVPSSINTRKAFQAYKKGLENQVDGKYAQAFELYIESLELETDSFARSYLYYNIGIIYSQLNQTHRALINLNQSLRLNPSNTGALNNIAVTYHKIAENLLLEGELDQSDIFFERAREYWLEATRLAPDQYLQAQNWLT
jgi:tetratricopeptide (TPR) repeat protein